MNALRARLKRALPYIITGLAAAYLYSEALGFEFHRRPGTLGPNAWPLGVSLLMLAVCLYKAVEVLLRRERPLTAYEALAGGEPADEPSAERHPWLLVAGMLATLAYVGLVTTAGFFLCTVVYLAVFLWIGGYRKRGAIAAISVIGTLVLMLIFMKLVYVSLPIGQPPFASIMLSLMQVMGIR